MSYNTSAYNAKHAFDPAASVFVSANAGTGKTSLLTNRVLALLLSGIDPSKLLCLTYTHAAASEMATRILEKLGKWVMCDDKALALELEHLLSNNPSAHQMAHARGLFAKVLEAPEGVRIQTIHSFCQSLLRRFPIEAGISPHFSLMDSRTEQELLKEARMRLFSRAQSEDAALQNSLNAIASLLSESSFHSLLSEIIKNKRRIRALFSYPDAVVEAQRMVYSLLKLPYGSTLSSLQEKYFTQDETTRNKLRSVCALLLSSSAKTDQNTGQGLAKWLEGQSTIDAYAKLFITTEGKKRDRLFTQKPLTNPSDINLLLGEQERIWNYVCECRALETAQKTTHILHIAESLLALYEKLKSNHAMMDYDDLILTARALLHKPDVAPWVLYKLDGGIDHILIDEAQDTSPEQWDIAQALTEEFFSGVSSKEQDRSLFVVGDEKQSIYSFQGAAPKALGRKEQDFSVRINDAAKSVHKIKLTRSFRSTPEVLAAVDTIFSQDAAKSGLMFSDDKLEHIPHRAGQAGLVELWPLAAPVVDNEEVTTTSKTMLARHIAATIRSWLDEGMMLESQGRPVTAGDIMILIRKRSTLVDYLVRALKRKNIPVAGHDRMKLGENLAVQDLIALAQCLLLPDDDLTLASVLKSPIFNLSEEQLFSLCSGRGKSRLWERLQQESDAFGLLSDLRSKVDFISPYELFVYLLDTLGARKRFVGRMGEEYNDAIDEFLGQALAYERSHTASMQGFIAWLQASDTEIKRDMEQAKGCIRIMTVHGAKGLQAPIVILPDTVDVPRSMDTLLWYDTYEGGLPLWPTSSKTKDEFTEKLNEAQKQDMYAEYRRLLYVALTRAEDRLYITGFQPHQKVSEQSWYHLVEQGIKSIATPFDTPHGQGLRIGKAASFSKASDIQHTPTGHNDVDVTDSNFAFLGKPAPADPLPSQPLVPSRLALEEPAAVSPLSANKLNLFQRGNLIHSLLQYLPQLNKAQRADAAIRLSYPYRHSVSDADIKTCIDDVMRVIDNPQFTFLFSKDALTEVPIAGCVTMNGATVAVAGQIDRLCIGDNSVWIVDYKSNRIRPKNLSDIPVAYTKQMALYHRLLQQIYPDKIIRCALLWTVDASITPLDEVQLSSYI